MLKCWEGTRFHLRNLGLIDAVLFDNLGRLALGFKKIKVAVPQSLVLRG